MHGSKNEQQSEHHPCDLVDRPSHGTIKSPKFRRSDPWCVGPLLGHAKWSHTPLLRDKFTGQRSCSGDLWLFPLSWSTCRDIVAHMPSFMVGEPERSLGGMVSK